ncbi:TIGR04255 family protein [Henriciella barbarensis]|uniref:TIGR04255 family protein n=1 Tax=Henriciella barbarensis TaxID=86342 RepID=A0A399R0P3_9PROT|nr:TIGR04255 family protein [Henriciella barbarensis]RIJ23332.1 TIGR04255 family protein [Henriciella barbarensis]
MKAEQVAHRLPKKLGKEPLIDAVFEFRFSAHASFSEIVPGFLFSEFGGKAKIERLGPAELPRPVRDQDAKLRYVPIYRLQLEKFTVLIGDRVLALACKLPYPGWGAFKPEILGLAERMRKLELIEKVERHSIKYVNIVASDGVANQLSQTTLSLELAGEQIKSDNVSLRIEKHQDSLLNVIQLVTGAEATRENEHIASGIVIDIDTIVNFEPVSFHEWLRELPDSSEKIRAENRKVFFSCLHPRTIDELEPIYE